MNRQQFGTLHRQWENSRPNDPQNDPLYDDEDYCECGQLLPCDCEEEE